MVDTTLQPRRDEQYPLLKIDGGGDINHAQTAQTLAASGWGVTCTKNSRFSRWPEFISACWMTLILCGISFLVFHALGMSFYRRQQLVVLKCNTSMPASNVFYHSIIHRGSMIPFVQYTEYLANMATLYPLLHFNVFFLIDDYYPDALRSSRRYAYHPPPYHSWLSNHKLEEFIIGVDAFVEFQKRYENVNVTIISLSKYMAMTPLKFKWRMIPQAHLAFYARVFSVWQNGGIGIDLRTFNNDYLSHQLADPRIDTILKQHNSGINTADYTKALHKIDNDEANAVFSMFTGFINNLLNETRSFFNKTLSLPSFPNDKNPLNITHRSKRQTSNTPENKVGASNDLMTNFYTIDNVVLNLPNNHSKDKGQTSKGSNNATTDLEQKSNNSIALTNATQVDRNGSEMHRVILFYDFHFFPESDDRRTPHYFINQPLNTPKEPPHLLSINAEGTFIAATSKLHPFLAHLTSAGCFGMHPKFAIQDALLTQCSGLLKDDVYCNNIYIL